MRIASVTLLFVAAFLPCRMAAQETLADAGCIQILNSSERRV
jgi:hypothetical protein